MFAVTEWTMQKKLFGHKIWKNMAVENMKI